jgi:hypothetical protein
MSHIDSESQRLMERRRLTAPESPSDQLVAHGEPQLFAALIDHWVRICLSCCLGMNVLDSSPTHRKTRSKKQNWCDQGDQVVKQFETATERVDSESTGVSRVFSLDSGIHVEDDERVRRGSSGSSNHSGSSIASDSTKSASSSSSSGGSGSEPSPTNDSSTKPAAFWWPWMKPAQQQPKHRFPSVAPPKPFRIHETDSPEVRARAPCQRVRLSRGASP